METPGEGLLNTVRPPSLEDAGLEDCALSPEAITEAFLIAANSIKSRGISVRSPNADEKDSRDCVKDPGPSTGEMKDALIGGVYPSNPGACGGAALKGRLLEEASGDEVVIAGEDRVILGAGMEERESGRRACVEGLQGLEIEEEKQREEGECETMKKKKIN